MNIRSAVHPVAARLVSPATRRGLVVTTLAATLLATAACGGADAPSAAPAAPATPTSKSAASSPTSTPAAQAPGTYRVVDKICPAVDDAPLKARLNVDGQPTEDSVSKTMRTAIMRCSISYRTYLLRVQIQVVDGGSVESLYQGLRSAHQGGSAVTEVPGVGQGAYSYVDDPLGPSLVAYDGNLHISVGVSNLSLGGGPVPDVSAELAKVATGTMAKLRG